MFDQSFSAENYLMIFNEENRKGHITFDDMPEKYQNIVREMKRLKDKVNDITKKKKKDRSEEDIKELEKFLIDFKDMKEKRDKELMEELNSYADVVNVKNFLFPISFYVKENKQIFTIDTTKWVNFFAIKNIQRSLRSLFNVKQANKHQILSDIRTLLNTTRQLYIIRTDISGFYESIPQEPLLKKLDGNNLVNNKIKGLIRGILYEFNNQKDLTNIRTECGVPRGIGISSYLSEIYMHDIDEQIKKRKEVIFYARYVDDIFLILAGLPDKKDIEQYYEDLKIMFLKYGLILMDESSTKNKCNLVNFYTSSSSQKFTYLGYEISLARKKKNRLEATFKMPSEKFDRIMKKIDAAFIHFENLSTVNLKKAELDLLDSLNLISGNYRLTKSKAMVKAGLYYGSDLLTTFDDLINLTTYLHSKSVNPYSEVLKDSPSRNKYISKIKRKIIAINFKERWHNKTMFKFNSERLKEISSWL
jgi:hypothetical protein